MTRRDDLETFGLSILRRFARRDAAGRLVGLDKKAAARAFSREHLEPWREAGRLATGQADPDVKLLGRLLLDWADLLACIFWLPPWTRSPDPWAVREMPKLAASVVNAAARLATCDDEVLRKFGRAWLFDLPCCEGDSR
jgi:hypothetical protein